MDIILPLSYFFSVTNAL